MRTVRHTPGGGQKRVVIWTAAVLTVGLLAGCSPSDPGLQPATARQLQARVLEVSEASSRNDPATAMKALEGFEAELAAAQGKGQVSEERRQTITTIAAAVRADLEQAIAAAAKAAEDAKTTAEQAPAETAAPSTGTPSPAPAPVSASAPATASASASESGNDDDKRDNEGKGKGKD
ncbi:hypothetical protein M8J71_04310 [Pseudarthrobacter sp. R1]|uniref:FIMAH domain-containing protein n=1 Tax=Pseudarthrobacter sp. R1 TaxID=2944934 RepID=UPI00210985E1|nr:hypothetical protein [Pseudarthrobacter sp. R1]MCQ6269709.1 hypothetical protein [Pseudarthrobacter sp. R1]